MSPIELSYDNFHGISGGPELRRKVFPPARQAQACFPDRMECPPSVALRQMYRSLEGRSEPHVAYAPRSRHTPRSPRGRSMCLQPLPLPIPDGLAVCGEGVFALLPSNKLRFHTSKAAPPACFAVAPARASSRTSIPKAQRPLWKISSRG